MMHVTDDHSFPVHLQMISAASAQIEASAYLSLLVPFFLA
jgi:hypothetical protein